MPLSKRRFIFVLLLLAEQFGCARMPSETPRPYQPPPREAEQPVQPEPMLKTERQPSHGRTRPHAAEIPAAPPAVMALLKEANASRSSGRLDQAVASLERAVRIQPRNPLLWQQMAEIRLQQHQPGLAEDLAKKSNVLAKGNRAIAHKNWTLIAEARRQKGDVQGAQDAEAKAGH